MKQRHIAVCCAKKEYSQRFVDFAGRRKDSLFAIHGFTDVKSMENYVQDHPVEMLLLSDELLAEYNASASVGKTGRVFLLTDSEYHDASDYPFVYMFQSCRDILCQIEDMYAELSVFSAGTAVRTGNIKKIAVYSPISRIGKTSFSIAFGTEVSKRSKVLYLNMEEYSGFDALYPETSQTLSELMYFLKQGKTDFTCKLEATVRQIGSLDYIPPLRSPLEYASISGDDWESLIYMISRESLYDILVLDMGCLPAGLFDILESCDFVYTPVSGDERARAKIAQYKDTLKLLGAESILERSSFPEFKGFSELEETARSEGRRWSGL